MTHSDVSSTPSIPVVLKRDACGRVRRTPAQRAEILHAFTRSGLSGPLFARVVGVPYQTFATWRQQQRRDHNTSVLPHRARRPQPAQSEPSPLRLIEVSLPRSPPPTSAPPTSAPPPTLSVTLPGGATLILSDPAQTPLAIHLIKALTHLSPTSSC